MSWARWRCARQQRQVRPPRPAPPSAAAPLHRRTAGAGTKAAHATRDPPAGVPAQLPPPPLSAAPPRLQTSPQPCNTTFWDAITGASSDTTFFELGLKLAGAKDKLPDPNALPVTILVPNDRAWLDFLFSNGVH